MSEYSIIISTFADMETAKKTAKILVERRFAACAQMFPIESVYLWKGEICDEGEIMLFMKSRTKLFSQIADTIRKAHPYEVPEIIQVPITDGLPEYLRWINDSTEEKEVQP